MALIYFEPKVIYALLYRITQGLIGAITIIMIAYWFKPIEQGYYYTFGSVLGFQVIFEMGFSYVILQHAAHHFTYLSWSKHHKILGDPKKLLIFELFIGKCFLIYTIIAIFFFISIYTSGLFFFKSQTAQLIIDWKMPWLLMCLISAANLLMTPFLAIIEGSNLVVPINQFRIVQNFFSTLAMAIAATSGLGLLSIVCYEFLYFMLTILWLSFFYRDLFAKIGCGIKHSFNKTTSKMLPWKEDIWPMQWRIAISWISGYFINQIYTPVIFYFHGAIAAGQLGMSMTICNMMSMFTLSCIAAYNPQMCQLIANQNVIELDSLFKRVFLQTLMLMLIGSVLLLCLLNVSQQFSFSKRFVSLNQMSLLLIGAIGAYVTGAIAILLRAFKREPFMWLSLTGASLNLIFTLWFAREFSTLGIAMLYLLLNIFFGVPTAFLLWYKNNIEFIETSACIF